MPLNIRTEKQDKRLKQIVGALRKYEAAHPKAEIDVYRRNIVSVRIRVISPEFQDVPRADREDDLWAALTKLPDDTVQDISLVILLTPDEAKKSMASMEFDDPVSSEI